MTRAVRDTARESEVTDQQAYMGRRKFLGNAALACGALALSQNPAFADSALRPALPLRADERLSTYSEVTQYNNYYEFSTNKEAVHQLVHDFELRPWTVSVEGEVENPRVYDIDDLIKKWSIEQRVYRLRCVEGWSMVIPWNGFALCGLLALSRPTSKARFVAFESVVRPEQMVSQRRPLLDWPYREGLRLDEAMHPLTFLATGLYDTDLPTQNGAPLRLVVPWKYGFKSIKAITRIRLQYEQPATSWSTASAGEYGFYANVNPNVPHPRWSQSREVRIGEIRKRPTLAFNGYAEHVAQIYNGMDLAVNY